MSKKIERNYLEIRSLSDLKETILSLKDSSVQLMQTNDFQLNKFFYKNIGKNHKWVDRLTWSEEKWINYVSNESVRSYVFKFNDDLVGFFELIFHPEKNETEIAYFGILEEYQNKKLGSYLLSEAIKKSFENKVDRVWVHTCSLDHKNALSNYISRGMKIFKTEILNI